ncbi:MAG: RNA polymerase sigma factor [Brevundimonas sp.]|uniref:RNA polymerase sigma factor n=1 Tax=Brevundimonas sp. TaxID=1871086 RepID=UPI002723DDFA|nr:RNA polymerase sigma factor [Brevundimonas sp.]MDO9587759.1 RNA polymerase sigma factor [Brevundimonas sp.]MDP3368341.1 RNA polymerase sigma factor [Brevundimonas sp.]MDP3656887.1 RNA polymerase sigma factor [Brevundimonas sp.]MDZ4108774.1 RNA polymerase sigma factor [Brevundimonas sp.]
MGGVQSDAELVGRALSGSDAAFSRLIERHQAAVRGFLRRMLGGGWAEADDVAQDAFLAAWGALRLLKDPAGVRAWLCGIAWRKAQDRIRSSRRGAARDNIWLETVETPAGVSPEDRMSVTAAMAELPPDVRACVALCLADGWSHGEASMALGLPLGTVKSHVARGRARLLKALGGSDDA